jgi:hypothetical protein
MRIGAFTSQEVETNFFGDIDNRGAKAVEAFARFSHPQVLGAEFDDLLRYLSTQRLRTPKGLDWLARRVGLSRRETVLSAMVQYKDLHCALWAEAVWQIADATNSRTKFIITDHPVTVYNRACPPGSAWSRGSGDPSIARQATHTFFPLSSEKLLILTNLSWVRNPYQRETRLRPNPNPFRAAMFNFTEIQTLRSLSEIEVRQINLIAKARAHRYAAAANEDWLYPERHIDIANWSRLGDGYLFMPDPRGMGLGGTVMWGNADGSTGAMDEYGRTPGDPDYQTESTAMSEAATFQRFQGEFARLIGPTRRGRASMGGRLDAERDSDDFHQYHLSLENRGAKVQ